MSWAGDLRADLGYAVRQMRRAPGFAAIAITTLALGIGANTAIFSVIHAVLMKPLPYKDSDRLVHIVQARTGERSGFVSDAAKPLTALDVSQLVSFRSHTTTLSDVAALGAVSLTLTGRGAPVRLDGAQVSPGLFAMLGAAPALGRRFKAEEEAAGGDAVVILSHSLWQTHFAGDPNVVERAVMLEGRARVVVGVMPRGFAFPDAQTLFWVPFVLATPESSRPQRVPVIARLKDGATLQAAQSEVDGILSALGAGGVAAPRAPDGGSLAAGQVAPHRFELVGLEQRLVDPVRPGLALLGAAVGALLLIACANVANLLLAKASARERELAMRLVLGASRGRLLRQLLTESVALALTAGLAGIALAFGGVQLLQVLGATLARRDLDAGLSIPRLQEAGLDAAVLAFNVALSAMTGVTFGILPALRHSRGRSSDVVRHGGGSSSSGFRLWRRHRARGLLVAGEIGISVLLLVASGLLIRSFLKLAEVNPGYDARSVLTFQAGLEANRTVIAFADELVARLSAMPGVQAAGYTRQLPLTRARSLVPLRITPELPTQPAPPPAPPGAVNPPEWPDARHVSHRYLDTMRTRVIAGRGFTESDGPGQQVMLINEALARSGLLGPDPVGRYVYALGIAPWEIIGIVEDVRQSGLDHEPGPQVFMDVRQLPGAARLSGPLYVVVRTRGDPLSVAATVRRIAGQIDSAATVGEMALMEALVANSRARPRLYTVLVGTFAGVAVVLAGIGLYGVISCAVSQRTREIGIRMALGAEPWSVLRLFLQEGAWLVALGVALGLAGAGWLTRYLSALLFGLTPLDPPTFAAVSVAVAAVAAFACYIPARRAVRVDPLTAIRHE